MHPRDVEKGTTIPGGYLDNRTTRRAIHRELAKNKTPDRATDPYPGIPLDLAAPYNELATVSTTLKFGGGTDDEDIHKKEDHDAMSDEDEEEPAAAAPAPTPVPVTVIALAPAPSTPAPAPADAGARSSAGCDAGGYTRLVSM